MKTKLFLTGLAIMATTTMMNAQTGGNRTGNAQRTGNGKSSAYVDKNNDGICDNAQNRKIDSTVKSGNRSGNCNGTGKGKGKAKVRNYVDANNNGVCDYYEVPAAK